MTEPFKTDSIQQRDMPSGSHVFELEVSNKRRWGTHRGFVPFSILLTRVPTSISFTNVQMDGTANLEIVKITNNGFWFKVTSLGTGKKWGLTSVSFDWEANYE